MKTRNILFLSVATLLCVSFDLSAQKYFSKNATIQFNGGTSLEKIEGVSSTANTVVDAATGQIEFAVLINGFRFEKALMEEHFNENYMESTQYPKSTFKGQIENPSAIQWTKPGTYKAQIKGKLTLHGVTKDIVVPGEFIVGATGIQGKSSFKVKCEDYGIKIPALVRDKIAREIEITVNSNYQPFNR